MPAGEPTASERPLGNKVAPLPTWVAYALVFGTSAAVLVLEITSLRLFAPDIGITLETRQISELRAATRQQDQSELDWWTTQSQLMAELVPDVNARFPRLAAADADGAFEFEHEPDQYPEQEARNGFEFGLERLLDGIEAFVSRA